MRSSWLAIIISLALFIIPFFWLKPGEINLGGDSSRLFLYDPKSFLFVNVLYGVVPSDIGGESVSYYAVPYMALLAVIKSLFLSSTNLIALSNGLTLSLGFLFVYLIVREILQRNYSKNKTIKTELVSCLAGSFYVLCPFMLSGWDRTLLNHYQIFLNPLLFFFLLKFFTTANFRYLLTALFTTFIFSFNFSFIGAPSFFAFYPLSLVFLLLYTHFILKKRIPIKMLLGGLVLFLLLQSFHLLPHIANIFSQDSTFHENIFSENKILSRGRDYFIATAPSIKPSMNFFALLQGSPWSLGNFFFVCFPLLIVIGFLINKSKLFLLTAIIFFIAFFFATANITNIGLFLYKELFLLPGFAMFRSFYGQWGYVFVFFYALLLGQALFLLSQKIHKRYFFAITLALFLILIINALPLLTGKLLHHIHHQTEKIDVVFTMDPVYEQSFQYVKELSADGKILTFPLSGFGYQVLSGKDGGAYVGPPILSYLGGKNDFSSYDRLVPFNEKFVELASKKDYAGLSPFLSVLNIKYLYHNADPHIYNEYFPNYPYEFVKDYLPVTQIGYTKFIEEIPFSKIKTFGQYFKVYAIDDSLYFPHVYVPQKIVQTNDAVTEVMNQKDNKTPFVIVESEKDFPIPSERSIIAEQTSSLAKLDDNYHLHTHEPFISKRMDDIFYPLAIAREEFELRKTEKRLDNYVDFSLLYLSKRVYELNKYNNDVPVLKKKWSVKNNVQLILQNDSYSWEGALGRYEQQANRLTSFITKQDDEEGQVSINKIKINEQLYKHQLKLKTIVRQSSKTAEERKYLQSSIDGLFDRLYKKLAVPLYDYRMSTYTLPLKKRAGEYEAYTNNVGIQDSLQMQIAINGKKLLPKEGQKSNLIPFNAVTLKSQDDLPFRFLYTPQNLVDNQQWINSGQNQQQSSLNSLVISSIAQDKTRGMQKRVNNILPKTQYLITFDYRVKGGNILFSFIDKRKVKNNTSTISSDEMFTHLLTAKNWQKHQSLVATSPDTIEAFLQFANDADIEKGEIDIRNLTVTQVQSPTIFFRKVNTAQTNAVAAPDITFTKINPTKYRVHVSSATQPYVLVLSESFNSKWKLIDIQENKSGFSSQINRIFASFINTLGSISPIKQDKKDAAQMVYFNGKIKEEAAQNVFLDSKTGETWGKNVLPEENHFAANAYANGWYVDPSTVNGKKDYDFVIELASQKMFYLGIFISSCTLIICMLLFVIIRAKR